MAHLFPEAARLGSRGPIAATGVAIGVIVAVVLGLTVAAPTNCGPTAISIVTSGLAYVCDNIDAGQFGMKELHTISWLAIAVAALIGGAIGATLGDEGE